MKFRKILAWTIFLCLFSIEVGAVVAFLNEKGEVVFLDLEKREILSRSNNPSLVKTFENIMVRGYYDHFDMDLWRRSSNKVKPDFIKSVTWGEQDYYLFENGITACDGERIFDWREFLHTPTNAKYTDLFVHNDTMFVCMDSATLIHSICDTNQFRDAEADGIISLYYIEPFFMLKYYTKGLLSISSVYHPQVDYFLRRNFHEKILGHSHIRDMYLLTPRRLYKINPILRKNQVVLRPKDGYYFRSMFSHGTFLYILMDENSIIAFDTHTQEVESISSQSAKVRSMGIDDNYVYMNIGSEVYCLSLETLEVHHVIKLLEDMPRGTMLTVEGF